jgi:hypothetical protein
VVLDTGGVLAMARRDAKARAATARVRRRGGIVVVPSAVLVEVVRGNGPRDAPVNRTVASAHKVIVLDEELARDAGKLLAGSGGGKPSAVDAVVAACAQAGRIPTLLLTSDPNDLRRLLIPVHEVEILTV